MTRDHVAINRDVWNADAENWIAAGERLWKAESPVWGSWNVSEESLKLLPEDLTGKAAIELGCGTGYVSGWMALFAAIGFAVKNYQEVFAPDSVTDTRAFVPAEWARKYPVEKSLAARETRMMNSSKIPKH